MSERILISIGCNNYVDSNSFGELTSAELDASQVFDLLRKSEFGDYGANSQLLLSPTLAQVQEALRVALFESGVVDTLTIFFAGHGVLKKESFFLCLSDSKYDALSATGLSLSTLLQMIAEAAPTQANIFVDACESGGVAGDLGAILKHDVLGKGRSPSVTLVAAAASDQPAVETSAGGIATQALLGCITGANFVNNSTANLDLVDIGRTISKEVASHSGQTPFVWGLNLFGAARFCKNPHYSASSGASLQQVGGASTGVQAEAIRVALPKLYRLYEEASHKVDSRALNDAITPVIEADKQSVLGATLFVSRLQSALREQMRPANDRFAAIEASTVCLLPLGELDPSESLRQFIAACALNLAREASSVLFATVDGAEQDKFALLGSSGLADLYYLPLRLTKALGWAGAVYQLRQMLGEDLSDARVLLARTAEMLIRDYSTAFRAVSDAQAPNVLVALTAMKDAGLDDAGEALLSLLFNSVLRCEGNVARNGLPPPEALIYLQARAKNDWKEHRGLVSQPSELILVLLSLAPRFSLEEPFDLELRRLDHVSLNAFVPARWEDLSKETISDGVNHTMMVGHHFFTVADFTKRLEAIQIPEPTPEVGALAILASLIFPDRSPWFLWRDQNAPKQLA